MMFGQEFNDTTLGRYTLHRIKIGVFTAGQATLEYCLYLYLYTCGHVLPKYYSSHDYDYATKRNAGVPPTQKTPPMIMVR